ncbi:MAG TPA: hypothetical protein VFQ51_11710 [Vicinamibacteria bacterium]|nr:hypothetical protein [Vicinamibacteria bacterium]
MGGTEQARLLSDDEVEEIRVGLSTGMNGPVLVKWARQLLGDHDARVRIAGRSSPEALRARYGARNSQEP